MWLAVRSDVGCGGGDGRPSAHCLVCIPSCKLGRTTVWLCERFVVLGPFFQGDRAQRCP